MIVTKIVEELAAHKTQLVALKETLEKEGKDAVFAKIMIGAVHTAIENGRFHLGAHPEIASAPAPETAPAAEGPTTAQ